MKLGDKVRDRITGYEGVVTGKAEYITGCKQLLVTSQQLKTDGDSTAQWIDEVRLTMVAPDIIPMLHAAGGPSDGPTSVVKSPPTR